MASVDAFFIQPFKTHQFEQMIEELFGPEPTLMN